MEMNKIMVIGSGQMGNGIAQVAAQAGYNVLLNDISIEYAQKGLDSIERNLSHDVEKERKTEGEKENILGRIQLSDNKKDAAECQLIIEAAVEKFEIKNLFLKN